MKRIFVTLTFLSLVVALASAQQYKVLSVTGSVVKVEGKKQSDVTPNASLAPENVLKIGANSTIVMVDVNTKRQYTCKQSGIVSVAKLLMAANTSTRDLTVKYFAYLLNKVSSKTEHGRYNDDVTASLERETPDSAFCAGRNVPCDSIQDVRCDSISSDITTVSR